ncbi:MAG: hypothetical protein NVS3B5_13310 [Sphingomicrobium sp.]
MAVIKDYHAEIKALGDRQRKLRTKHAQQLGDLVVAIGADVLDAETLAGMLLASLESNDKARREAWRQRGAAYFQAKRRTLAKSDRSQSTGKGAPASGTESTGPRTDAA